MQPEDIKISRVSLKLLADHDDIKVYCYKAYVSYGKDKWIEDGVIIRKPKRELSISLNNTLYVGPDDNTNVEQFVKETLPDLIVYGG